MVQFPGPPPVPVFADPVKNKPVFGPRKSPSQPNVFPGMQVLIAGSAAPGFIIKAAQYTGPEGHVFVVRDRQAAIDRLEERVQAFGFDNLTLQVSATYELDVPDASVDRVYWVSVLDKITDKMRALKEARRVLKPDGLLGVDQRLFDLGFSGRKAVLRWCKKGGFEPAASYGTPLHYLLVFRPAKNEHSDGVEPPSTSRS
jgi:ubiquinone/menaquinone biosynthesis C-methylase UbiE